MQAIRVPQFGDPAVLQLESLPDLSPGASQVRVSVRAVGVNPVDTYIRAGKYGPKQFPYTPGTDAAGVVEQVGANVKSVKPGDRVYVFEPAGGAYASQMLADEKHVFALPDALSFEQGASIGVPSGTAYRALIIRGKVKAGETILVHGGSGGVGLAAIQLALPLGIHVVATAGTEKGIALIRQQGVTQVVNHRDKNASEQLMACTGARGFDAIIELVAHANLGSDLPLLAKRGRVVVIGSRGPVEVNPRDMMQRDSDIRGMSLMHADDAELRSIHAAIGAGLQNGTLKPVIAKTFPLKDAPAAHEAVVKDGAAGKIVLLP